MQSTHFHLNICSITHRQESFLLFPHFFLIFLFVQFCSLTSFREQNLHIINLIVINQPLCSLFVSSSFLYATAEAFVKLYFSLFGTKFFLLTCSLLILKFSWIRDEKKSGSNYSYTFRELHIYIFKEENSIEKKKILFIFLSVSIFIYTTWCECNM